VVKWWLLFLCFREPEQAHFVAEEIGNVEFTAVSWLASIYICTSTTIILLAVGYFGLIALMPTIFLLWLVAIEVPHIIYDRPRKRET